MKSSQQFVIQCRYERRASEGVSFCDWYVCDSTPCSQEEAKQKIKELKESSQFIDKKTKLKHEFRQYSYDDYVKDMSKIRKEAAESMQKSKEYYASAEYKELLKKKRQSAKEQKERQKKYLEQLCQS